MALCKLWTDLKMIRKIFTLLNLIIGVRNKMIYFETNISPSRRPLKVTFNLYRRKTKNKSNFMIIFVSIKGHHNTEVSQFVGKEGILGEGMGSCFTCFSKKGNNCSYMHDLHL